MLGRIAGERRLLARHLDGRLDIAPRDEQRLDGHVHDGLHDVRRVLEDLVAHVQRAPIELEGGGVVEDPRVLPVLRHQARRRRPRHHGVDALGHRGLVGDRQRLDRHVLGIDPVAAQVGVEREFPRAAGHEAHDLALEVGGPLER